MAFAHIDHCSLVTSLPQANSPHKRMIFADSAEGNSSTSQFICMFTGNYGSEKSRSRREARSRNGEFAPRKLWVREVEEPRMRSEEPMFAGSLQGREAKIGAYFRGRSQKAPTTHRREAANEIAFAKGGGHGSRTHNLQGWNLTRYHCANPPT